MLEVLEQKTIESYIGCIELEASRLPLEYQKIDFYFQHRCWDTIWKDEPNMTSEQVGEIQEYFNKRENETALLLGIKPEYRCCHVMWC
jgi:hypothetical protein